MDTRAFRERATRECLDLLGSLRSHREPVEGETWLVPLAAERRLVAQLTALQMLGPPALEQAQHEALDPDVPDADRVFASLLLMSGTSDEECLVRCLSIFERAVQRDRGEATAAIEALCLSPHAGLGRLLSRWLPHESIVVRSAVVKVLGYRGELSTTAWCDAARDADTRVAMAALGGSSTGVDRARADSVLRPLYLHAKEPMVRAALRAGMAMGLPSALRAARDIAGDAPTWADSLYLVMIHALPEDRRLRESTATLPPLDLGDMARALRTAPLSRPQRQELFFEMQVRAGGRLPRFNAWDFIGTQHDDLDRIDAALMAHGFSSAVAQD